LSDRDRKNGMAKHLAVKSDRKRAVFLDRDGTINREINFVKRVDDFILLEGAGEAIHILNQENFLVIVLTNQSGVARGFFSEKTLQDIHEEMRKQLASLGAKIDGLYYCPHHPTEGQDRYLKRCSCRKPQSGLFLKALEDFQLDPKQCYAVGDKPRDLIPARELGCKTVYLNENPSTSAIKSLGFRPQRKCATLLEASRWIVKHCAKRREHLAR